MITLDNGLKTLLISDPDTDKAAAALDVRVGSMSDPDDIPGLAHFLEHMLFYASEKYPLEDEYSKFVSEHGGHTNAYTAAEDTNYHFDCNADALPEALDRFAQFFIAPLVSKEGVQREANAVDSEHGKNLNSDPWKKLQLWKATSHAAHPFSKFSTGNLATLLTQPLERGQDTHSEVLSFYRTHYSANLMRLVVYGREGLDELQQLVSDKFAAVPNQSLKVPVFSGDVLTSAEKGLLLRMVPEKEGHVVEVQWDVPPEQPVYRASPCGYLGRLLGDEGEGSAFALLKARGWAESLVAGEAGTSFSGRSFFMVRCDLTDEGHRHVKEVLSVIFQYIRLVRDGGVSEARYEENRSLQALRFNFRDKSAPFSYAQTLSSSMQTFGDEDLLLAVYGVPQQYDPDAIHAVLAEMVPANARVMWASKSHQDEATTSEPIYGTCYSAEPLPDDWLAEWGTAAVGEGLALPPANPFVPTDLTLMQEPSAETGTPSVIHTTDMATLYYKADTSFHTPKAVMYVDIIAAEAYTTPENAVLTRLVSKLLQDYLNELIYPAELAGLYYGLSTSTTGLQLWLGGYHHKLPQLLDAILAKLGGFAVKADRFELQRDALAKEYENHKYNQPYQYCFYLTSMLLEAARWHVDDYKKVIPTLTPQQLQDFVPRLFSRVALTGFVAGNLPTEAAKGLMQRCEEVLVQQLHSAPLFPAQLPQKRVVKLQPGITTRCSQAGPNPVNENSAAVVLYQGGPDDLQRNVLAELFVHVAKRDAFHTLRTVEQLGYIVSAYFFPVLSTRNVAFILQSSSYGAGHMDARVEAFLQQQRERIEGMSDDEFTLQVAELAKAKLDKPKSLRQQARRDWDEILEGTRVFGRQQREVQVLQATSRQQLVEFAQAYVFDVAQRRKLSVHVRGCNHVDEKPAAPKAGSMVEVEDIWAFKRASETFASPV